MLKSFAPLLLLIINTGIAAAQYFPKEGSNLNYTLIGFSYPASVVVSEYKLEIAEGNYNDEFEFVKHISYTHTTPSDKAIKKVASFGKDYTWDVVYKAAGGKTFKSVLHHFSTLSFPLLNGTDSRLLVTTPSKKYTDAYIFSDGGKALYNTAGEPVWFLPIAKGNNEWNFEVRDLKLSPTGSITFFSNNKPFEINYDGDILWEAPNPINANETGEGNFHHEFSKLGNGHYMVLGNELVVFDNIKGNKPESVSIHIANPLVPITSEQVQVPLCTLLEYDKKGNIIWKWESINYFKNSDIFNRTDSNGYTSIDPHANAFYFDEKSKIIYVSFKQINRVIAINYITKEVVREYGERYVKGVPENKNPLFSEQHAVKLSNDGNIYLFNNKVATASNAPSILVLKEPAGKSNRLQKIWEFNCPTGNEKLSDEVITLGRRGGNVLALPNKSFFVAMCSPYWTIFIVNKDKKINWAASLQKYDSGKAQWLAVPSYRASIITTQKEIGSLVWGGKYGGH